ncbi:MAG TPA: M48 family metalloprotease, partial [Edaphobacter sp.]
MRQTMRVTRLVLGVGLVAGTSVQAWARFQPQSCKNSFTEQQEITEGGKVAAEVFKQMPVLPDSSPVSLYVRQLGAKLVAVAPGYKWPYNFHVVASEEINAFALPGGAMFVNLGTIQAAETEAQLAGVMAHEISHVVMRHSTCNLTKQQTIGTWAGLGQLAATIALGTGALGSVANQGIGMATGFGFLKMSRDYEKQADLLGAGILYDAGYDPRGLPQFFETIQAKYGSGGAQFFSDHPNPGNRTQYVNAEIATLPTRANATVTSTEFTKIR